MFRSTWSNSVAASLALAVALAKVVIHLSAERHAAIEAAATAHPIVERSQPPAPVRYDHTEYRRENGGWRLTTPGVDRPYV